MKKSITLLFLLCLVAFSYAQKKSALFLGNSYTYYNGGLPAMCSEIALSLGDSLSFDQNTPGGYTLEGHSTNSSSLEKIASQAWDFVVLQEQSQMPSFPQGQVATEVYPYAAILCDSIYSNDSCTLPLFFMTWGRENGDASNCDGWPPVCTYEGMQLELRRSYLQMAEDNHAAAAPVGMVWKAIREDHPEIDLYSSDGSHPSLEGTYLAANVFYASMFHRSPEGGYIPDGIDASKAEPIQEYAANIVFDSLDTWQIDTSHVTALFIPDFPIGKSLTGYFANLSENGEWYEWDFGDGSEIYVQTDYHEHVEHVFPTEGDYNVCLTAWSGCKSDLYCEVVNTDFFQNLNEEGCDRQLVYDQRSKVLEFAPELMGKRVWIYDASGRLIDTQKITAHEMRLNGYSGVLMVKVQDTDIPVLKVFAE